MVNLKRSLFLKFLNGKWILWDYQNHRQYELDRDHFIALYDYATGSPVNSNQSKNFEKFNITSDPTQKELQSNDWGWDELSHVYHYGSMDVQLPWTKKNENDFINEYLTFSNEVYGTYSDESILEVDNNSIFLTEINLEYFNSISLIEALKKRRTTREFIKHALTFAQLSTILRLSCGPIHGMDPELTALGVEKSAERKLFPSPGNIHPEEFFIQINSVEGIDPGIYYYHQKSQSLIYVNNIFSEKEFKEIFYGQYFQENCSFLIFMTSRLDRLWWKYKHSRAYRMAQISIGAITQNLQVINNATGLDSWMTGHFHDSSLKNKLKLPKFCYPFFVFASGKSVGRSIPSKVLSRIKNL